MILDGLNKIKQQSIMTAIMLMAAGLILVIWPTDFIGTLLKTASAILIVWAMLIVMNYTQSRKRFMDDLRLIGGLILGLFGLWIMVFDVETVGVLKWGLGILLIIDGLHSCLHGIIYARRAHRRCWGFLIPVSLIIIALGVLVIICPFGDGSVASQMHSIGWMVVGAAATSMIRLIWMWPLREPKAKKEKKNEEKEEIA